MTNGQSGCFMWMVLLTGGMMFFIAVDKGCLSVGDPSPSPQQIQFEAPPPVQPRPTVRTTVKPGPLPVTPKRPEAYNPPHPKSYAPTPSTPEDPPPPQVEYR